MNKILLMIGTILLITACASTKKLTPTYEMFYPPPSYHCQPDELGNCWCSPAGGSHYPKIEPGFICKNENFYLNIYNTTCEPDGRHPADSYFGQPNDFHHISVRSEVLAGPAPGGKWQHYECYGQDCPLNNLES